jgi:hypothetical protein
MEGGHESEPTVWQETPNGRDLGEAFERDARCEEQDCRSMNGGGSLRIGGYGRGRPSPRGEEGEAGDNRGGEGEAGVAEVAATV